jgi:hypothetical protein
MFFIYFSGAITEKIKIVTGIKEYQNK